MSDFSYLWKKSPLGAPPKYDNPQDLWNDCTEYFQFCQDTPLLSAEIIRLKDTTEMVSAPKLRAYTLTGLCCFLGITTQTWNDWQEVRPDLFGVLARANEVIRTQKFEAAAVEMLNPGFIARDLGMVDRKDITTKDKELRAEPDMSVLSDEEVEELARLSRKLKK